MDDRLPPTVLPRRWNEDLSPAEAGADCLLCLLASASQCARARYLCNPLPPVDNMIIPPSPIASSIPSGLSSSSLQPVDATQLQYVRELVDSLPSLKAVRTALNARKNNPPPSPSPSLSPAPSLHLSSPHPQSQLQAHALPHLRLSPPPSPSPSPAPTLSSAPFSSSSSSSSSSSQPQPPSTPLPSHLKPEHVRLIRWIWTSLPQLALTDVNDWYSLRQTFVLSGEDEVHTSGLRQRRGINPLPSPTHSSSSAHLTSNPRLTANLTSNPISSLNSNPNSNSNSNLNSNNGLKSPTSSSSTGRGESARGQELPQYQFAVHLDSDPHFEQLRQQHGSFIAFHGSPLENWHSIVRKGLKNMSGTKEQTSGALFGDGIYFSDDLRVSRMFSRLGGAWKQSALGTHLEAVGVYEILNMPGKVRSQYQQSSKNSVPEKYFVVSDGSVIKLRYLLLWSQRKTESVVRRERRTGRWLLFSYALILLLVIFSTQQNSFRVLIQLTVKLIKNFFS